MNAKKKSKSKPGKKRGLPTVGGALDSVAGDEGILESERPESKGLVLATAFASLTMLWLSFPPIGIWWLAWLAPVPLIWLVASEELPDKRPYRKLWLAGFAYWLATFYFIPIPHPALFLGWFLVCLYMSIYTPLMVAISRTLVHRFKVPTIVAVPIVWTGIEWIRCNFATGMGMVCLSHSQYEQPTLIQVASLSGAYTLTLAMVMVAAGFAMATVPRIFSAGSLKGNAIKLASLSIAAATLVAVVVFGRIQLESGPATVKQAAGSSIQVGLIQSSIDTRPVDPSDEEKMTKFLHNRDLTYEARRKWSDLDLIVWPEGSFPTTELLSDYDDEITVAAFAEGIASFYQGATGFPFDFPESVPMLVGSLSSDPAKDEMFNSALLISGNGKVTDRYFKIHRVMVGEYLPFADWFPILKKITPIGRGLTAGSEFKSIEIKGVQIAPNICFESTVPHFVRRQINTLDCELGDLDAMVNLTNDGWFFGTSLLDLHLACNVFRAVEMGKMNLVCGNTGFSAEIDSKGRILQVGPRRETAIIKASVPNWGPQEKTLYRKIGDVIPMSFGLICIAAFVIEWSRRKNKE